jgi:uroporphyrinogen decarboxylase
MAALTGKERMARILDRKPVDRIAVYEAFWTETKVAWIEQGHLKSDELPNDHFNLDLQSCMPFNVVADLDFVDEVVQEDENTKLVRNGNGALLRWWKSKMGTPEHVDFGVKDESTWGRARELLRDSSKYGRRINVENYRANRRDCVRSNRFFTLGMVNVFECMHPLCGHENMLVGMALEPQWVKDMCDVYSELTINLMEELFAAEGLPDGAWFYEDMGFKNKPFMSPAMYKDIVWPAHKRTFDYCHSKGLKVIVHSCGFIEPLVPGLIEAGMDCLQALEVKAGMDLVHMKKTYGDKIAFMGGMDVRPLVANDIKGIDAELESKLPAAMAGGGYCLHSDHSIPSEVKYETYKHFVDRGLEIGTY